MTRQDKSTIFSRRAVLKAGGALVVSIGAPATLAHAADDAMAVAAKPPLTPDQLSSYIAVNGDGTVAAYFGKMDMGQGLFTAVGQIVAEELDVPFKARQGVHGRHRDQRQSGRRVRLDRPAGRRQADAHGRGRSAARAGRHGGRQAQRCRPTS